MMTKFKPFLWKSDKVTHEKSAILGPQGIGLAQAKIPNKGLVVLGMLEFQINSLFSFRDMGKTKNNVFHLSLTQPRKND